MRMCHSALIAAFDKKRSRVVYFFTDTAVLLLRNGLLVFLARFERTCWVAVWRGRHVVQTGVLNSEVAKSRLQTQTRASSLACHLFCPSAFILHQRFLTP